VLPILATSPSQGLAQDTSAPLRARVVDLVNAERARVNMPPLEVDPRLEQLAMQYADIYVNGGSCAHACGPVPKLLDRFAQAGLPLRAVGENLAGRYQTPEAVMLAWAASPSHRDNILNPSYDSIGVAVAHGWGGLYWVQEFAKAKATEWGPKDAGDGVDPAPEASPEPGTTPLARDAYPYPG
jgi:uncharacterized protein YkwD